MENVTLKNKLLNLWLNSTEEYIFFKGIDGTYLAVSNATAELAGFNSAEDMIGKYDVEIYEPKLAQAFLIQDKQVMETRLSVTDSDWVEHPKKGKILIETIKSPMFDENGDLIGVQGISRDITEKAEMREKLVEQDTKIQTILDCIPLPLWLKNKENRYALVNQFYRKFFHIKDEHLFGHNIGTVLTANHLFSETDMKLLEEQDQYVLLNKRAKKIEVTSEFDDGAKKLMILKSPIVTKEGKCLGLIGLAQEVHKK